MPDYGLFLNYKFNNADGIFLPNPKPRKPAFRFWDQVIPDPANPARLITVSTRMVQDPANPGGPLIATSTRINADTKTMELVARPIPPVPPSSEITDRIYFAVNFAGGGGGVPVLNSISFSIGLNPTISFNTATVGSPFRFGSEIQCLLTGRPPFTQITSVDPFNPASSDTYDAIGPYNLVKDPIAAVGTSCFFKLTVVAAVSRGGVNREFSYDPDMDVEMGL